MIRFNKLPELYKRLIVILIFIAIIFFGGTAGYLILETDYSILDAVYMTTITLATVGFHEVGRLDAGARVFTIILIVVGISTLGYAVGSITSSIVEGQLRYTFRDRKMEKNISKMKNHIILCGHGRLGKHAASALKNLKQEYVIIEQDMKNAEALKEKNVPCVYGNATEDEVLIKAGVKNARGLITALAEDTDNLFVTLTARRFNKDLEIISRANYDSSENKLIAAGADKVLLPTKIAGRRMACMMVQPEVASFLDDVIDTDEMELSLQEFMIPPKSKLDGVLIKDAQMPREIRIIGLKAHDGKMIINRHADQLLEAGRKVIVLGNLIHVNKYLKEITIKRRHYKTNDI